jgi:hypothetical protein
MCVVSMYECACLWFVRGVCCVCKYMCGMCLCVIWKCMWWVGCICVHVRSLCECICGICTCVLHTYAHVYCIRVYMCMKDKTVDEASVCRRPKTEGK